MGNTQLPFRQRHSLVDAPQQDVAEEDRPDEVLDFFEADAMLPQRGGLENAHFRWTLPILAPLVPSIVPSDCFWPFTRRA